MNHFVTAHMDSVNIRGGREALAPGTDDNASGAAGVLEIARMPAEHSARPVIHSFWREGAGTSWKYTICQRFVSQ